MIWFFIAGWIAGAAFMVLYARWWVKTHMVKVSREEALKEIGSMNEEEKSDD